MSARRHRRKPLRRQAQNAPSQRRTRTHLALLILITGVLFLAASLGYSMYHHDPVGIAQISKTAELLIAAVTGYYFAKT